MNRPIVCLLAISAIFPVSAALSAPSAPQVKTLAGVVEGKDDGTVRAFLGIPYAKPPVGDLRWKPPAPAAKWNGVKKATEFGFHCMQGKIYGDMVFHDPGASEDCLTLNVWIPDKHVEPKLPVMVWIYGGGFVSGTTSESRQDGSRLAQQGVIVVSMNYRLGVFGFMVHPELAKESGHNSAGNYGLLDQLAALMWVRDNIARDFAMEELAAAVALAPRSPRPPRFGTGTSSRRAASPRRRVATPDRASSRRPR